MGPIIILIFMKIRIMIVSNIILKIMTLFIKILTLKSEDSIFGSAGDRNFWGDINCRSSYIQLLWNRVSCFFVWKSSRNDMKSLTLLVLQTAVRFPHILKFLIPQNPAEGPLGISDESILRQNYRLARNFEWGPPHIDFWGHSNFKICGKSHCGLKD